MRVLILIFALIFTNCFSSYSQNLNNPLFNSFNGKWISEETNTVSYEIWEFVSDSTMEGKGITVSKNSNDTVFYESLRILEMSGEIFYIAKVGHNKYPTSFKLTSLGENYAIFENGEHDFPQKIKYELTGPGEMSVSISGLDDDGKKIHFSFRKI